MFLAVWCSLVVLLSPLVIGLAISKLLLSEKDCENYWIKVPFLGISIIVLILQNLVYLNIILKYSTLGLWVLAIVVLLTLHKKHLFKAPDFPRKIYFTASIVYVIQSIGLFIAGAKYYVGRAWMDQLNYVITAQFLVDRPFSFTYSQSIKTPYLFEAIFKKTDRIGQSILHGFFSVTGFQNTKIFFEPTIILSVPLIFLAVYLLAKKLGLAKKNALLAGSLAALSPGIAFLHLESFLSNVLAVPFLLFLPSLAVDYLASKRIKDLIVLAIVSVAASSIYTEFLPLFILIFAIIGFFGLLQKSARISSLYLIMIPTVASLALIPAFAQSTINILKRTSAKNVLEGIYPFALSKQGLMYLWFGSGFANFPTFREVAGYSAIILTATAYFGLLIIVWKKRNSFSLSVLIISFVPVALYFKAESMSYQFYKLLLSVSPVLLLGFVLAVINITYFISKKFYKKRRIVFRIETLVLIATLLVVGSGTFIMAIRSTYPGDRSAVARINSKKVKKAQKILESNKGKNFLIACNDNYINGWLAYYGRDNNLLLTHSAISDLDLLSFAEGKIITDIKRLPKKFIIINMNDEFPVNNVDGLLAFFENDNNVENDEYGKFTWLGKQAKIGFISQKEKTIRLKMIVSPGPSFSVKNRRFCVESKYRKQYFDFSSKKNINVELKVPHGYSEVYLKTVKPSQANVKLKNDTRILFIRMDHMEIM